MNHDDRRADEIYPNFYGGLNKKLLQEAIETDQAAFRFREQMRAQKLQEQHKMLEYHDYARLKLTLAQEGLDDITAINKLWEKRLTELKSQSEKKYVKFVITSLILLVLIIFLSILLGIPEVAVVSFILLMVILPRSKPIIDTKDLLLWNLFNDK
ncbi:MAG: hypothetical protein GX858_07795 [Clostridiales bacterium]|jgi:Flp pilus assembly protein TadB|nr:hypothetical protein [Clostridiales bacterium]